MEGSSWGFHSRSTLKAFCEARWSTFKEDTELSLIHLKHRLHVAITRWTSSTAAAAAAARPPQTHLVLLAPSLLVVVEDVVADVLFRLPDKQPRSFPDVVASPTGGRGHGQQQQHCEEDARPLISISPENEIPDRRTVTCVKRAKLEQIQSN